MKSPSHPRLSTLVPLVAFLGFAFFALPAQAQKKEDPFGASGPRGAQPSAQKPKPDDRPAQMGILMEFVALEHPEVSRVVRKYAGETDASELRKEVQALVDQGKGEITDTQFIIARSGQRAKSESIAEMIYPTEWEPGEIPEKLTLNQVETQHYIGTPTNPAALETRNVGVTIEVDPVLGEDGEVIDLNMSGEFVEYLGEHEFVRPSVDEGHRAFDAVSMPKFYTQRVTTAFTVRDGRDVLLSVFKPSLEDGKRILVFCRVVVLRT